MSVNYDKNFRRYAFDGPFYAAVKHDCNGDKEINKGTDPASGDMVEEMNEFVRKCVEKSGPELKKFISESGLDLTAYLKTYERADHKLTTIVPEQVKLKDDDMTTLDGLSHREHDFGALNSFFVYLTPSGTYSVGGDLVYSSDADIDYSSSEPVDIHALVDLHDGKTYFKYMNEYNGENGRNFIFANFQRPVFEILVFEKAARLLVMIPTLVLAVLWIVFGILAERDGKNSIKFNLISNGVALTAGLVISLIVYSVEDLDGLMKTAFGSGAHAELHLFSFELMVCLVLLTVPVVIVKLVSSLKKAKKH